MGCCRALAGLESRRHRDPKMPYIVLVCYVIRLTMNGTAKACVRAERSLDRHWRYIRAWFKKRLR